METYRRLEDLVVNQKLCRLHIEVSEMSHREKQLPGSEHRWSLPLVASLVASLTPEP